MPKLTTLNKELRSKLFHTIAMKLIRTEVEEYQKILKDLALEMYRRKYRKDIRLIESLPDGFMRTKQNVYCAGLGFPRFILNSVAGRYMPASVRDKERYWCTYSPEVTLEHPVRIAKQDEWRIDVKKEHITKRLLSRAERIKKQGVDLHKRLDTLLTELQGVMLRCKTVKELREQLPEFAEFYPPNHMDNLPVQVSSIANLKKAARSYEAEAKAA